jgi:hypothetical protein
MKDFLFKLICFLVVLLGSVYLAYNEGQRSVQVLWDKEKAEAKKEVETITLKQADTNEFISRKYIPKINKTTKRASSVNAAVKKYIPPITTTNCVIPNNAITILDAAITNSQLPNSE